MSSSSIVDSNCLCKPSLMNMLLISVTDVRVIQLGLVMVGSKFELVKVSRKACVGLWCILFNRSML